MTLAILEGAVLFAGVCGSILVWGRPLLLDWLDVAVMLSQAATLSLCCIVAFYYNDLYDLRIVRNLGEFVSRLLQAFGVALILLAGFYLLFPTARIAEGPFLSSVLVMVGLILPLRAVGYAVMRRRVFVDRVLLVGSGALARKLIAEIEARPHYGYEIVGVIDDSPPDETVTLRYPFLGPLPRLTKIVEEVRADRVVVAMGERRGRMPMEQLLEIEAHGVRVEDGLLTYERFARKLAIEAVRPSLLVFSEGFRRKNPVLLALQRMVSVAVAGVGLVLTAPLMAAIACGITLDSGGPVLFVQARVGQRGRSFRLFKFRTMVPSPATTSEWVNDNEDRITRVGRWLRKFRLDELPQFVNILRGDMNLVGPRPHPVSNSALLSAQIPYYLLRASVRPGVTGWAQVRHGYANSLEEEIEKMRYDLYYIKHLSFWFDLRILFDTIKIVMFGRGAHAADADAAGRVPGPAVHAG